MDSRTVVWWWYWRIVLAENFNFSRFFTTLSFLINLRIQRNTEKFISKILISLSKLHTFVISESSNQNFKNLTYFATLCIKLSWNRFILQLDINHHYSHISIDIQRLILICLVRNCRLTNVCGDSTGPSSSSCGVYTCWIRKKIKHENTIGISYANTISIRTVKI